MEKDCGVWEGKTAWVTGAAGGIGRAIVQALWERGVSVAMHGLPQDREALEAMLKEGRSEGHAGVSDSRVVLADLADPSAIASASEEIHRLMGAVDILVNNAGLQHVSPVEEFPPERWDAILGVNLSAAFHTIRLVVPGMKAKNFGRIINIASTHGLVASAGKAAYVASKHGLLGLTKVVALELAPFMINCNAVCPGWVRTPLVEKQIEARAEASGMSFEEEMRRLITEKQPNGRFATVEDIARTVVFLADPASAAATGAHFVIDGGWTAW